MHIIAEFHGAQPLSFLRRFHQTFDVKIWGDPTVIDREKLSYVEIRDAPRMSVMLPSRLVGMG